MAYKIGDFTFDTIEEAKVAEKEAKAIAYITSQMKSDDPEAVLALYCQILEKDLFHTKLGLSFLQELYQDLLKRKELDGKHIPPVIKVEQSQEKKSKSRSQIRGRKITSVTEKELKRYKKLTHILAAVCVTMTIIIVGMFVVNASSQHPTILNYEQKLLDKYAGWEEELNQREEELIKREQRLNK